jgi:release factor glutamine methyltransferase
MLKPVPEPIDLIVANLPYVKESELTPQNFEPLLALDGGAEGTESIARLCRQAKSKLAGGGSMLLEIGAGQGETITGLLKSLFPDGAVEVSRDFSGIERVISLSLSRAKVAK